MIKLADKLEDQKKQNRAYVEVNPTPSAFDTGEQAGRTQLIASNSKLKNVNLSDTDLKRENEHSLKQSQSYPSAASTSLVRS